MIRAPLEQAFETCQKNKSDWMSSKSALARAEMALKEHELTSTRYEPDAVQALRDDIDLKKWAVNQSAGRYIRSHEAVQRVSIRRQLHAFMPVSYTHLDVYKRQPIHRRKVRWIWPALSVLSGKMRRFTALMKTILP